MEPRDKVQQAISHVRYAEEVMHYRLLIELQTGFGPRARDCVDTARLQLRLAIEYLDSLELSCFRR